MENIVIYTIRTDDHYRLGTPAVYALEDPDGIDCTWIERAEYALPDGYHVSMSNGGTWEIYNATGHHCPFSDSAWMGKGGDSPILVDNDVDLWRIKLDKVRDLPW